MNERRYKSFIVTEKEGRFFIIFCGKEKYFNQWSDAVMFIDDVLAWD